MASLWGESAPFEWPVRLCVGSLALRPFRKSDGDVWQDIHRLNRAWLKPWSPTMPTDRSAGLSFQDILTLQRKGIKSGRQIPFAIEFAGELVGQVNINEIAWGVALTGSVGYWIDHRWAGRGITPAAVALAMDHALGPVGLHRLEVNIRPENIASLRVVQKLRLREEGVRERYLHIDGQWRDHRCFAVTTEELSDSLLSRVRVPVVDQR